MSCCKVCADWAKLRASAHTHISTLIASCQGAPERHASRTHLRGPVSKLCLVSTRVWNEVEHEPSKKPSKCAAAVNLDSARWSLTNNSNPRTLSVRCATCLCRAASASACPAAHVPSLNGKISSGQRDKVAAAGAVIRLLRATALTDLLPRECCCVPPCCGKAAGMPWACEGWRGPSTLHAGLCACCQLHHSVQL